MYSQIETMADKYAYEEKYWTARHHYLKGLEDMAHAVIEILAKKNIPLPYEIQQLINQHPQT